MPPVLVEGRANRQALDEESMHSLPVEDLEDAIASRGTGRLAVPVFRTRLRSLTQDLQRVSQPYGAGRFGTPVSGGAVVLMDKPAEQIHTLDRTCRPRELVRCHGDLEAEPAVRAGEVVVGDVGGLLRPPFSRDGWGMRAATL